MTEPAVAVVQLVPAARRGKVLTSGNALIENGLFLGQALLFLALGLTPAIAGGLMSTGQILFDRNQATIVPAFAGLALSAGLMWLLAGQLFRKPWSAQYVFHTTRAELQQRADALFDVTAPDAILAEIIPRRNWGQIMLQNAEDRGFLLVDSDKRQLLFEGDHKRYQIPAEAIVACDMEVMNRGTAEGAVPVGLVVLSVRDHLGPREIPIRPIRTVAGDPLGRNYVERASALQRRIEDLCGANQPADNSLVPSA
jgi:hypothetical protein